MVKHELVQCFVAFVDFANIEGRFLTGDTNLRRDVGESSSFSRFLRRYGLAKSHKIGLLEHFLRRHHLKSTRRCNQGQEEYGKSYDFHPANWTKGEDFMLRDLLASLTSIRFIRR